jgi:hypothetical protein
VKKLAKRPLSIPDILRWADSYREANGRWPTKDSGTIVQSPFETWARVDAALRAGTRGLDGGSSLAQLLAQKRGARNIQDLSPLTEAQILAWSDAHHERTGAWPTAKSGRIAGRTEHWQNINNALQQGRRGLPGGSSLARLLAAERGVRNARRFLP